MTNNTNNQEWWMKEFETKFGMWLYFEGDYKHVVFPSKKEVMEFIRKVSKQSREDALKERTEGILKGLQELSSHGVEVSYISNGETKSYVTGLGNLHIKDVEKMFERDFKLPPKQ